MSIMHSWDDLYARFEWEWGTLMREHNRCFIYHVGVAVVKHVRLAEEFNLIQTFM